MASAAADGRAAGVLNSAEVKKRLQTAVLSRFRRAGRGRLRPPRGKAPATPLPISGENPPVRAARMAARSGSCSGTENGGSMPLTINASETGFGRDSTPKKRSTRIALCPLLRRGVGDHGSRREGKRPARETSRRLIRECSCSGSFPNVRTTARPPAKTCFCRWAMVKFIPRFGLEFNKTFHTSSLVSH